MKKTLLCLFALLLSATVVDAQKVAGVLNAPSNVLNKKEALRSIQPMKAPSVPNRIALDEGERLFGAVIMLERYSIQVLYQDFLMQ